MVASRLHWFFRRINWMNQGLNCKNIKVELTLEDLIEEIQN